MERRKWWEWVILAGISGAFVGIMYLVNLLGMAQG